MSEKIKVTLDGTAETMLQSFYARAKYSLKKGHKFYDAKAVELVNKIDYDFSSAEEDSTMSNGVIARTLVFDELVEDFIDRNSECTVVNIACGLDTRFYRMDNGKLRWYNLDLPETIAVRDQIYQESGRVSTIGISALDPAWADQIDAQGKMLFMIFGLPAAAYAIYKTSPGEKKNKVKALMIAGVALLLTNSKIPSASFTCFPLTKSTTNRAF